MADPTELRAPSHAPYDEPPGWPELWDDCAAILGRYPRLSGPAADPRAGTAPTPARPIPPAAADAADLHIHLD